MREKLDQQTGFADDAVKARKLHSALRLFDSNNSGTIDYREFFAAMAQLNFVGCQAELEGLFNRYDDDASGTIDYKEFAFHIFGIGSKPALDVNSKNIIEKVRARIIAKDGASGIHNVRRILSRMDTDGSKALDRNELLHGLREYGITNVPPAELQKIFNAFDRDRSGKISVDELMRGLNVR